MLTYVHLALLLMPSALAGNSVAMLSIAVYSAVVGVYVVEAGDIGGGVEDDVPAGEDARQDGQLPANGHEVHA